MAVKIVQTVNRLSASSSTPSLSEGIALKSGYIRVSTGSTGAYVAIGTNPVATINSFHIPPFSDETLKETLVRQKISGITTGSTTVVTFSPQSGNYFNVGDYVSIEGANPSGINTSHVPVLEVTSSSVTINYDSSSTTNVVIYGDTVLAKSVKVSVLGAGSNADVSICEVVQLVSE